MEHTAEAKNCNSCPKRDECEESMPLKEKPFDCPERVMWQSIEKKILPKYFDQVICGKKTFELRKDENSVQAGDILVLREWDGEKYTGREVVTEVTYVLRNVPEYGLMDGFCIMALKPRGWDFIPITSEVL